MQLTINRFGEVKHFSGEKNGKAYSFYKVGFQTNEYGERWFNFTFNREPNPLTIGKKHDLEVTEREYQGKTYYDARFPKKEQGMSVEQYGMLMRKLDDILTHIKILEGKGKSWTPTIADADFTPVEDDREVPIEAYDDPSTDA